MAVRWYAFEEEGPYDWGRAKRTEGPYYAEKEWFDAWGYCIEQEAVDAIQAAIEGGSSGPFFVMKGYQRAY